MSNSLLYENLVLAMLVVRDEHIAPGDLEAWLQQWDRDRSPAVWAWLVERGYVTAAQLSRLQEGLRQLAVQHGGDLRAGLAALRDRDAETWQLVIRFLPEPQCTMPELPATLSVTEDAAQPSGPPDATASGGPCPLAGDRFRVLSFHDQGGLGRVMLARDEQIGRTVALKEIRPDRADDPENQVRFVVEAEVTGGLEHPGIVPVYALGRYPDQRPYYVMRFIRGSHLGKAINAFHQQVVTGLTDDQWRLEMYKLLRRFIDMCNAVEYAHSRGVLHRDLKPANVMLGKFGETLVVDWGLAKIVGRTGEASPTEEATLRISAGSGSYATMAGSKMGTPAYMSPEQAAGDLDALGPASDVYSLGATLYYLLTDKPPFSPSRDILKRVQRGEFDPPRKLKPETPKPLEAICLKAMARLPADRYASPAACSGLM